MLRFSKHCGALCSTLLLCLGVTGQQTPNAGAPQPRQGREAAPQVTAASIRAVKTRVGQPCPTHTPLYGTITTNGKTTVKYTWVSTDGKKWPTRDLTFNAAGSKSVTETWELGEPGKKVDQSVQLKILSPNRLTSPKMTMDFTCGAGHKSPKKPSA